jgi:hypothetical protein
MTVRSHSLTLPILLRRIATVCFLLVIALILRTITDNQIINTRIGSILGMTYAAVLLLLGWRLYAERKAGWPRYSGLRHPAPLFHRP